MACFLLQQSSHQHNIFNGETALQ